MTNSQNTQDFEQVVEKIVFDEDELETLKTAIREFSNGKMNAKHLKQLLLQCRGRIVNDVSQFLSFCIDRKKNEDLSSEDDKSAKDKLINQTYIHLQQELSEKNELLKTVAKKVNSLAENFKKKKVVKRY
ncbi:MAG: hypothetical protein ACXABG_02785 [Promethearchaeota archaeon]|jgi:exonuclease VII small subunit